jgi:hypothetical protein
MKGSMAGSTYDVWLARARCAEAHAAHWNAVRIKERAWEYAADQSPYVTDPGMSGLSSLKESIVHTPCIRTVIKAFYARLRIGVDERKRALEELRRRFA